MNRMRIIILLVALALVFTEQSCTEEGPKTYKNSVVSLSPMILNLSRNTLDFSTFESSSQTLYVTSTGTDWEFTDIPDWLIFNPSAGGKGTIPVEVICSKNEDIEKRIGVISFRSIRSDWNYSTKLSVSQIRNVYTAVPEKESIEFAWTVSQAIVKINANIDSWEVAPESAIKSWCNVRKLDDAIEINCSENTSTNPRKGKIEIKTIDKVQYINIVQSPIELDLQADSTALFFSDKSGSSQMLVMTYPGVHWIASTQYDWISLSPQEGTGDGIINVTVTENTDSTLRTGLVNVATNESQVSMAVNQTGKFFDISSPLLSFGSQGGDVKVSIKTNDGWSASTTCEWIELSDTIGNTDCNVILKVLDNNTASDRDGTVIITPNHLNSVSLTVNQKARYLELSDSALIFWYSDTTKDMIVYTDGEFEAYSDCSWLSFDNDDNKLTVKVCGFDEEESVIDTIKVALKGLSSGTLIKKVPVYLYGTNDCFVDLGLSVKWAVRNVGANSIEDYGDYYAWGETEPYYEDGHSQDAGYGYGDDSGLFWKDGKSEGYNWSSYKYCNGQESSLTKYCNNSNYGDGGFFDLKQKLDLEDDVAHINWGGKWRMPTYEEYQELINPDNCSYSWTTQNGVKGYKVTSKKPGYEGQSIFLPAAGQRSGKGITNVGSGGYYWSSDLTSYGSYGPQTSYSFEFSSYNKLFNSSYRTEGCSVRPVIPLESSDINTIELDYKEVILTRGESYFFIPKVLRNDGNAIVNNLKLQLTSDNDSVAIGFWISFISEGAYILAQGVGSCYITVSYGSISAVCHVTVLDPERIDDIEHDYVDLGLGVKWATVNIGAYKPEGYGDYFAWGETETYYMAGHGNAQNINDYWKESKSEGYIWSSYFDTDTQGDTFIKYGKEGKSKLDYEDDVARVRWGDNWQIPTILDFEQLRDSCTWISTTRNSVKGYQVISNISGYEDRSIFLPAAGYRYGTDLYYAGICGYYWSDSVTFSPYSDKESSMLEFDSRYEYIMGRSTTYKYHGLSIRPVSRFTEDDLKEISIGVDTLKMFPDTSESIFCTFFKKDGNILWNFKPNWSTSNYDVATVSQNSLNGEANGEAIIRAYNVGSCTIIARYGSFVDSCIVTVVDPNSIHHDFVDLGLSVKWATMNVGAYSPEVYGDYFAWGETEPYYEVKKGLWGKPVWKTDKDDGYSWSSYFDTDEWGDTFSKYNNSDGKTVLDLDDDVAHVKWGGNWRIPTSAEFDELRNNCTWTRTSLNGVYGFKITSNISDYEGCYIFLPSAGYYSGSSINYVDNAHYWSSSLFVNNKKSLGCYKTSSVNPVSIRAYDRVYGLPVRPVCQ